MPGQIAPQINIDAQIEIAKCQSLATSAQTVACLDKFQIEYHKDDTALDWIFWPLFVLIGIGFVFMIGCLINLMLIEPICKWRRKRRTEREWKEYTESRDKAAKETIRNAEKMFLGD